MTKNTPLQSHETETVDWDRCEISYRQIDDTRSFAQNNSLSSRNLHFQFQFFARATGPAGTYTAARSPRVPLANMIGATPVPDASDMGHQNILNTLVETLQRDGWELLPGTNGAWWSKQLRRSTNKAKIRNSWLQRLSTWLAQKAS